MNLSRPDKATSRLCGDDVRCRIAVKHCAVAGLFVGQSAFAP